MTFEKANSSVLVVDDDDTSLTMVANMLSSWDYKVMSRDSRKKEVMMSKPEENEAALNLLKPMYAEDLKEARRYALLAARKGKVVIENESKSSEGESSSPTEKSSIEDVKPCSEPSTVTHGTNKRKKRYTKTTKSNENQSAENRRVQKKPKIVWTTELHNLFMTAIKQLGYDKAVPKKILEIMNIPYLTRGNIASHLQKYRIFLKNIAGRGLVEGLSSKILKSNFASGLTLPMIKDIQTRSAKLRIPVQQYLRSMSHQAENGSTSNASIPFNQGQISPLNLSVQRNAYVTAELGRDQFAYPKYKGLIHQSQQAFNGYNSLNPGILGQSSFGNNIINIGSNEMQQNVFGSNANLLCNSGPSNFSSYGIGHGLMTSTRSLTARSFSQNYGLSSFGNQSLEEYGLGNGNMASLRNSNNVPWNNSNYYPPTNNSYGIPLNAGSEMAGTTGVKGGFNVGAKNYISGLLKNDTQSGNMNVARAMSPLGNNSNNSFGLFNGTQNANMHVAPLGHNNISFDFANGTQHANGVGNEYFYNDSSTTEADASRLEGDISRLEDDISELFMMVHNTDLLNENEVTHDVSESLSSHFSSSSTVLQQQEQPQTATNVIVPPTESSISQQNDSTSSIDKNPNQDNDDLFVDWDSLDRFWLDSVSSESNTTIEQDWDMSLIEAFCGTEKK